MASTELSEASFESDLPHPDWQLILPNLYFPTSLACAEHRATDPWDLTSPIIPPHNVPVPENHSHQPHMGS